MASFWFLALAAGICAATAISSPAQTFTTLVSFDGTDGSYPAFLIQATDGNFYGTVVEGGASTACPYNYGCGTVFRITAKGTLTTFYDFCAQTGCPDGYEPEGLVQATDGNFYGTTDGGGSSGLGTVFKITPDGTLTTRHSFCEQGYPCSDGEFANGLIQATDGNFYGTTTFGGANDSGTVFRVTPQGRLTTLYSFCNQAGCTDGGQPIALVQAANGNFYGTTLGGGTTGGGTLFEITPTGTLTTIYAFCAQANCADGNQPDGLIQSTDGGFYGTTYGGGLYSGVCAKYGCGTVFVVTTRAKLSTLHSFVGRDGNGPNGLLQGTDGNLYGTASAGGYVACGGGGGGCGTVFEITPIGKPILRHSFNGAEGQRPFALIQATDGDLYGTTSIGGAAGVGTVFRLSVGLRPFVALRPTSAKMGAAVTILGDNLTGSTSVNFNGIAAMFSVNSTGTAINTTVPSGATTGAVQVLSPSGTLTSNVNFRVLP